MSLFTVFVKLQLKVVKSVCMYSGAHTHPCDLYVMYFSRGDLTCNFLELCEVSSSGFAMARLTFIPASFDLLQSHLCKCW